MNDLNDFAKRINSQNCQAGWWDGEQCLATKLQLISTEIAEATEGERKNLMDDHLPHRRMGEVELADALIRALDLGEHLGFEHHAIKNPPVPLDLGGWVNESQPACLHLWANHCLLEWSGTVVKAWRPLWQKQQWYQLFIGTLLQCGEFLNYDIIAAAEEKLAYNKTRSDHQRENRAKEHGKKF